MDRGGEFGAENNVFGLEDHGKMPPELQEKPAIRSDNQEGVAEPNPGCVPNPLKHFKPTTNP